MNEEMGWASWSTEDDDPVAEAAQEEAQRVFHKLARALLAEVRGEDAFPRARESVEPLVDRIRPRLHGVDVAVIDPEGSGEHEERGDARVLISPDPRGSLYLQSHIDESSWVVGYLYADGELAEEGVASGFAPFAGVDADDEGDPGEEMEGISERYRDLAGEAREGPAFQGKEFVRAVPAPPQPDALVQIRGIELYSDGLVVRYLIPSGFDWEDNEETMRLQLFAGAGMSDQAEELIEAALAKGRVPPPIISAADDVGTDYSSAGGGHGGVPVVRGEARFAPAVPNEARRLIVKSYAGTVEFALK